MKKAVVTGSRGFLGKYLVQRLTEKGCEVWELVREKSSESEWKGVHTIECDLEDILEVSSILKHHDFEAFYHLAWKGSSGVLRKDYALQLRNAKGCADAAVAASKLGCRRFIGVGSVTQLTHEKYMRSENSHPEPVACYAAGKTAAEYMTRCICEENKIDFLWAYAANFYGVGDTSNNIINFLIRAYLNKKVPELTEGLQKADFIYVSDVADGLIDLAEYGKKGNSYYLGYGEPMPFRNFVSVIHNAVNPSQPSGLGNRKFYGCDLDFSSIDIGKLRRDTGFVPKISFQKGIEKTIQWIQENKLY